jgi:hypothetical protein
MDFMNYSEGRYGPLWIKAVPRKEVLIVGDRVAGFRARIPRQVGSNIMKFWMP